MSRPDIATIAHTALRGTRFRATLPQSRLPGTAPSRENRKIIRDAEVTDAVRQKNCATTQMNSNASDQFSPIDSVQIHGTTTPIFSSAPWVLGIANVTASNRIQPNRTETTTDMYMPTAAMRDAWCVSSAMCAEASNPAIVNWDGRSQDPKRHQTP